ncbi:MAG: DHA2 family efflux MFS transporter permease subunit [Acidimicrobiia bacterium]
MDAETIYRRRWATLGVLSLSLVIIGLDNTILNVALPTLVRDLDASASQLQWMVDAYVLVFAGLLLTMGALGDRFGRKLGLNLGLLIFGGASVAAAYAGSAEMLIAARAMMGIGGALIMPSTLSIITNIFEGTERGRAIAAWAAVAGLGIIIGPVLGGWLLENFWWGSVFLINVFIVIVALALGFFLVPESKDPDATPLDPLGAILSIAGLATLVYAIIEAPSRGWTDGLVIGGFILAVVLLAAFLWWETRVAHPMLRLEFFENPRFSAASVAITLVFFAMFGTIFLLTQYLQFVLGFTPLQAGFRVMPVATMVVAAPLSARFTEMFGTKRVVATGLVIVAGAMSIMALISIDSGYTHLAIAIALLGVGMGTAMAPATDSIMGSLPLAKAGVGSAMNDTTRQLGGALGVAILGSVLASSYSASMAPLVGSLPAQAAAAASDSIGGAVAVAGQMGANGAGLLSAAFSAFIQGMDVAIWLAAGVALAGAILTWIFLPARPRQEESARPLAEAGEAQTSLP